MRKIFFILLILITSNVFGQEIICDKPGIADAYNLAISTININTRRGILAAGGDYGGEWTRDIAINSWNGVSLLKPIVAEKSLWSVTIHKDTIGHQYWDKIIWVIAAYNHYKATGNKEFLRQAYHCSANTMNGMERIVFDSKYGLFKGPSVFNDGIAGYPAQVYDSLNISSSVFDQKNAKNIKCLSTNCLYYGAYNSLIKMGQILNENRATIRMYQEKAENLKANILKYFYSEPESKLYYLIDKDGKIDKSQEGLGISFAILFGVLDHDKCDNLIKNVSTSKYGITSIYPDFSMFSPERPGRHNNIIWPMVNGFFAQASIIDGNHTSFVHELNSLIQLALDSDKGDYNFREIYNPYTGIPDGGWQCDRHWESCKHQTWSATAYLSMIFYGLAGIRLENDLM
ncbi:MAG: hypothetical protein Q8862_02460 [Bacteroidota bacterium]|nr:hypothetical protein [Bacteroidota bacterium]